MEFQNFCLTRVTIPIFLTLVGIVSPLEFRPRMPDNPFIPEPPISAPWIPIPEVPDGLKEHAPKLSTFRQFTNTSSFTSNSTKDAFSEKEITKKFTQLGDAGREFSKKYTNDEFVRQQTKDAKDLQNRFDMTKFTNASTDFEQKVKSAGGSQATSETRSEGSETSDSEVNKDRDKGEGHRRRKRRDLITIPKTLEEIAAGKEKITKTKKPVAPPDEEEEEVSDPSSFIFRNDEACREAFGGGKDCTKELWQKCRIKKCPGKDKEPVYCIRSGESIFKCHITCMRGPCGEGGALDEAKFTKPESKIEKEGKCTKKPSAVA